MHKLYSHRNPRVACTQQVLTKSADTSMVEVLKYLALAQLLRKSYRFILCDWPQAATMADLEPEDGVVTGAQVSCVARA